MATERSISLVLALAGLSLFGALVLAHAQISLPGEDGRGDDRRRHLQLYIVHVQKPKNLLLRSAKDRENWHKSFLPSLTLESGEPRLVYSYHRAIGGFAARLTADEAEAMEAADGVLSVQPDAELEPRTTYSHKFLGLTRTGHLWEKSNRGQGIIIGVIEQGFTTKHYSFTGDDMNPPPPHWKGKCDLLPKRCNNKLVGNRVFNASGSYDPDQEYSHGTHVASIAAGNIVMGAGFRGEACGSATGAAPRAHLALYSVNTIADFLMAADKAIEDGVDVLSISIGLKDAEPFHNDPVDIAGLSAVKHGVFVSIAAGNDGPAGGSVLDTPPWSLSVGASSIDRVSRVVIKLGNGVLVDGETANAGSEFFPDGASLPVIFPGMLTGDPDIGHCKAADFGGVDVSEKVVLCLQGRLRDSGENPYYKKCNVETAGGKFVILLNEDVPGSTVYYGLGCDAPAVIVKHQDTQALIDYLASDPNPTLSFEPMGTITGVHGHPAVADFSARGPNPVDSSILKPDILGPGVNILGAYPWTPNAFFYESGTSMACPHLSGIAAMLKSLHSSWSPAMIKSAIMTTADSLDNAGMPIADYNGKPASLYATGAGQVNGTSAADPGLVYDIQYKDYVKYVCGLGYTPRQVNKIIRKPVDCATVGSISGEELNYPSFHVKASSTAKVLTRTVMNVGRPKEVYVVSIEQPRDAYIDVLPRMLDFDYLRQNFTYTVTVISTNPRSSAGVAAAGQITWLSQYHRVRSPIVVTFA